jgi:hypothetical protein
MSGRFVSRQIGKRVDVEIKRKQQPGRDLAPKGRGFFSPGFSSLPKDDDLDTR